MTLNFLDLIQQRPKFTTLTKVNAHESNVVYCCHHDYYLFAFLYVVSCLICAILHNQGHWLANYSFIMNFVACCCLYCFCCLDEHSCFGKHKNRLGSSRDNLVKPTSNGLFVWLWFFWSFFNFPLLKKTVVRLLIVFLVIVDASLAEVILETLLIKCCCFQKFKIDFLYLLSICQPFLDKLFIYFSYKKMDQFK